MVWFSRCLSYWNCLRFVLWGFSFRTAITNYGWSIPGSQWAVFNVLGSGPMTWWSWVRDVSRVTRLPWWKTSELWGTQYGSDNFFCLIRSGHWELVYTLFSPLFSPSFRGLYRLFFRFSGRCLSLFRCKMSYLPLFYVAECLLVKLSATTLFITARQCWSA